MAGRTIHTDRLPVKCDCSAVLQFMEAQKPCPRLLEERLAALDVIVMAMGVGANEWTATMLSEQKPSRRGMAIGKRPVWVMAPPGALNL